MSDEGLLGDREALEVALRSRLNEAAALGDLAPLLEEGAAQEARSLTALLGENENPQVLLLTGWVHWYRALALPAERKEDESAAAAALFVMAVLRGAEFRLLPEEVVPSIANSLMPAASRRLAEALDGSDLRELALRLGVSRRLLAVIPRDHPDRIQGLLVVCLGTHTRFQHTGAAEDLDESVQAGHDAVAEISADRPERLTILGFLRTVLELRIERAALRADLDEAVELSREILAAAPAEERAAELSNLGAALSRRFLGTGNLTDLQEAAKVSREASSLLPRGHRDRPVALSNLAGNLMELFERTGVMSDLDDAVAAGREAADTTPANDRGSAARVANLGTILRVRHSRTGSSTDLDEAIALLKKAASTATADFTERAAILSNLGVALQTRYAHAGAMSDLDEAIRYCQESVELTPPGHPQRARWLANASIALRSRFGRTGALPDLDDAIQAGRDALAEVPADHADRGRMLANLGADLEDRYQHTSVRADLDEAISHLQQAVTVAGADAPERLRWLSALGTALQLRFTETRAPGDLDDAVQAGEEAATNTPPGHAERAGRLLNLGRALQSRYEFGGSHEDMRAAIGAYEAAVKTSIARPSLRIRAARAGAALAADEEPALAADLLETAVRLLPEVAPRELERQDQQHALGGLSGVAADAAALTLSVPGGSPRNRASLALRLLEAGRSVLFAQSLQVRSDLTELARRHPELAERFTRLRDMMEDTGSTQEQDTSDRRQLADQLTQVLAEIRRLDGFDSFALPPTEAEIMQQAAGGPVAVLNVSTYRSDALLLTRHGIADLPLPGVRYEAVVDKIMEFRRALRAAHTGTTASERRAGQRGLSGILEWLWDSTAQPVLEALGLKAPPDRGASLPRMWWATGGVMGFLPLHAAGYHQDAADGTVRPAVMDRVVSSYTPTVAGLRYARRPGLPAPSAVPPAVIVAMPTTPGLTNQGRLDFVREEARNLRLRFPDAISLIEPDRDIGSAVPQAETLPTRDNVRTHMPQCPIAHFACHGTSDPEDPSNSRLLLHDHEMAPFTVASLASIRLDHARLAYLSACETAFATKLLDEGIHLASAFQLAGYPNVVATLWNVNDLAAARIADDFYGNLAADSANAASALHQAVRTLRNELPGTPSLWAAHIHVGA